MGGTILPSPHYIDVRYPDNKLAFRYDPTRGVVEIQRNGCRHYFDLAVIVMPIENGQESCYTTPN